MVAALLGGVLALTVAGATPAAADAPDAAVVRVEDGLVRGTVADGYRLFQGIPYAAPPVGDLRWGSPRPATPWSGVRDATAPASPCAQGGDFIGDPPSTEEDCLYLNVTTPSGAEPDGKRPVMVWIHGGGFKWGSGAIYGAERLATRGDVVVVTINYRLGLFGFLAHPALDGGPAEHLSGNLGIEDQQAALRWVRRNAAAFGGDPGNVTIFGESAGAMSSCAHLTAPGSAGLFDRVIMQSGPCTLRWPFPDTWRAKPRAEAVAQGIDVATDAGCADPATAEACLRAKPTAELLAADREEHGFGPTFGGGVIPDDPAQRLAAGAAATVPVLHGTTRDEHVTFQVGVEQAIGPVAPADYQVLIGQFLGLVEAGAARVAAEYPLGEFAGSTARALAAVQTDWAWACPAADADRMLAGRGPTYAFEFADANAPWFADTPVPAHPTGAYHAGELQYLFSGAYAGAALSPEQQELSDRMIGYWTRFARTGDPHGDGLPAWPRFSGQDEHVQSLGTGPAGIGRVDLGREHRCGFWASVTEGR